MEVLIKCNRAYSAYIRIAEIDEKNGIEKFELDLITIKRWDLLAYHAKKSRIATIFNFFFAIKWQTQERNGNFAAPIPWRTRSSLELG